MRDFSRRSTISMKPLGKILHHHGVRNRYVTYADIYRVQTLRDLASPFLLADYQDSQCDGLVKRQQLLNAGGQQRMGSRNSTVRTL